MPGSGGTVRSRWRELSPEHRRWIYLNALLVTAIINALVNAGIACLSVIGQHRVPLWAAPLVDKPSTITDTVGTLFLLPLITCVLCTTAVWRDLAAGRLRSLGGSTAAQQLASRLPATRLRRGLALGALCTAALAPLSVGVLVAIDFTNLSAGQFVLYKAVFGLVLGAIVTPPIAVIAMTGRSAGPQGSRSRASTGFLVR
jgi:hypothetical protein